MEEATPGRTTDGQASRMDGRIVRPDVAVMGMPQQTGGVCTRRRMLPRSTTTAWSILSNAALPWPRAGINAPRAGRALGTTDPHDARGTRTECGDGQANRMGGLDGFRPVHG